MSANSTISPSSSPDRRSTGRAARAVRGLGGRGPGAPRSGPPVRQADAFLRARVSGESGVRALDAGARPMRSGGRYLSFALLCAREAAPECDGSNLRHPRRVRLLVRWWRPSGSRNGSCSVFTATGSARRRRRLTMWTRQTAPPAAPASTATDCSPVPAGCAGDRVTGPRCGASGWVQTCSRCHGVAQTTSRPATGRAR